MCRALLHVEGGPQLRLRCVVLLFMLFIMVACCSPEDCCIGVRLHFFSNKSCVCLGGLQSSRSSSENPRNNLDANRTVARAKNYDIVEIIEHKLPVHSIGADESRGAESKNAKSTSPTHSATRNTILSWVQAKASPLM